MLLCLSSILFLLRHRRKEKNNVIMSSLCCLLTLFFSFVFSRREKAINWPVARKRTLHWKREKRKDPSVVFGRRKIDGKETEWSYPLQNRVDTSEREEKTLQTIALTGKAKEKGLLSISSLVSCDCSLFALSMRKVSAVIRLAFISSFFWFLLHKN